VRGADGEGGAARSRGLAEDFVKPELGHGKSVAGSDSSR
jgi:hypothetical protein